MTDDKNSTIFKVLKWTIGLILVWLALEAFSLYFDAESTPVFRFLHLFLVCILFVLAHAFHNKMKTQQFAHSQALEKMQRKEEKTSLRYKNLLEGAGDAIFVINAETGHLEEMNDMGTMLLGYSREEMGALSGKDLIPAGDQEQFVSLVRRVNRKGMASSESLSFRRKDGSMFLGEVNARLIDLGDGKVVQAIVRDITLKKTAEQEIRKRNRKLSILNSIIAKANASPDLTSVLDMILQETMEVFDAGGGAIHLLEEGNILTLVARKNLTDRLIAATRQKDITIDSNCPIATTRQCDSFSDIPRTGCSMALHTRADGWRDIIGIPLFAKNNLIGVLHIMTHAEHRYTPDDISFFTTMGNQIGIVVEHARMIAELNRRGAELLRSHGLLERNSRQLALSEKRLRKNLALVERANLELERFDRMKSHFLGMVSHEFRTPLTAILCSADFLLAQNDRVAEDDKRRLLDIIHKGGTRLNEITSDLLKVARLEVKAPQLVKSILHLEEVQNLLMEQFTPLLAMRSQQVTFQGIESLPYFSGDKECLLDVFTRLLENAIKFTPDGGEIVIAASVANWRTLEGKKTLLSQFNAAFYEQMGNAGFLQMEVRDSGVGIALEERLNIFTSFYEIGDIRHHTSGNEKFQGKGAGLGLAIVKGMIEAHGGMVWVEGPELESAECPGSSFFVLVPLEEGPIQAVFPFMQMEPATSAQGLFDQEQDEMIEPE
jgi:PAS domain S-box-containing protein